MKKILNFLSEYVILLVLFGIIVIAGINLIIQLENLYKIRQEFKALDRQLDSLQTVLYRGKLQSDEVLVRQANNEVRLAKHFGNWDDVVAARYKADVAKAHADSMADLFRKLNIEHRINCIE